MAVDPSMMMGGGAPPLPPAPMAPMAPPVPGGDVAPAVAALPGMAQLAQAQTMQLADHQRQMAMMQEEMQKQMMMLIAALPTPNPAGEQAVSTPMTPMMAGSTGQGAAPSDQMMQQAPMGQAPGAY